MHRIKSYLIALIATILTGQPVCAQVNVYTHEVKAGETLYSLARRYGVTIEEIHKANPTMGDVIFAGSVINIPQKANAAIETQKAKTAPLPKCKQMYVVEKKETVYGISKKFGITMDELLGANHSISKEKVKKGQSLCIPFTTDSIRSHEQQVKTLIANKDKDVNAYSTIKVAVVLPFGLDNTKATAENQKMIEFYEGVLLAIDSLKHKGVSVDVFAFDEQSASYPTMDALIHQNPTLKDVNIMFGPMHLANLPTLAQFADANDIQLVVPFASRNNIVDGHRNMFQVNVNLSYVLDKIVDSFFELHHNNNVVFVNTNTLKEDEEFVNAIKQKFTENGASFQTATLSTLTDSTGVLRRGVRNIVVSTAKSASAFEALINRMDEQDFDNKYDISLFGYPEWQTFTGKNVESLYKYNSAFFATFFCNPSDARNGAYENKFRNWFGRNLIKGYPKYAMLGFDTGYFFINNVAQYGSKFQDKVTSATYRAYQNPMSFQRTSLADGFKNNKVVFVCYGRDNLIRVREF